MTTAVKRRPIVSFQHLQFNESCGWLVYIQARAIYIQKFPTDPKANWSGQTR
ncbi:uncharacterized protein BDW47DRAFT_109071 [Aspergillus candidus]|uniref:Uncharacterized protein n=1 Tax=Aspergillus candidus TaxID=41067 RepID=A0A2I2F6K9_ASPCN|nr:hypothetical protein BDW47DRAFT_109071 [Aspergillus candidus]PLB36282.1 hypothetical protein BDW47DRAFT_109071 [Aspergillus candidus]